MSESGQPTEPGDATDSAKLVTRDPDGSSRRGFCRRLAGSAGALVLASAVPAWAGRKQRQQAARPPAPAQQDAAETPYETKVLWDFDGCLEDRFMGRVSTFVYNGNAYLWVLLPGYKTTIVKAPLDGGKVRMYPLMPGHVTGSDPHRFYRIAADSEGYIHVVGDMHTSPHVKHWISRRPEDISEFVYTSGMGGNKRPQGLTVTYPHFFRSPDGVLYHSIRCADPVWGIGISVLDVKTQTWSMLGADVPGAALPLKRAKKARGRPMTAWEDNGEGGYFSYTQPHAVICWDNNKRMHLAFGLLDENTPSAKGRHTGSDVLYAYSDDGGRTFHRGNGSAIQLPMRAEAGPYQADVVYSRHDGPPPWVGLLPGLKIDADNRPTVTVDDHKTGAHHMVLENGHWTERTKGANAQVGDQAIGPNNEDEDEGGEERGAKPHLPYEPFRVDSEYRRQTGNILYTVFPVRDRIHGNKPKYNRIMLVLSKPVQAKAG